MTTDRPLNADQHYVLGEQLRACADVASKQSDFALAYDARGRARLHYAAAVAACAIWPGRSDESLVERAEAERDVVAARLAVRDMQAKSDAAELASARTELDAVRTALAGLQAVEQAARIFCEAEPESPARAAAYEQLFAAVRKHA